MQRLAYCPKYSIIEDKLIFVKNEEEKKMAETKKKKKIVAADTGKEVKAGSKKKTGARKEAAPVGNATGLRIGAVALWVVALALEVVAVLILNGTITWTFMPSLWQIIIALALDLVCLAYMQQPFPLQVNSLRNMRWLGVSF